MLFRSLSVARNSGIDWAFKNSESRWLSFVDSDDWIHPEMLDNLLCAAKACDANVSVCGYERTSCLLAGFSKDLLNVKSIDAEAFYRRYGVNATVAWGKLYRKECFLNIRYPVGRLHEDEFTTYKIIFSSKKIAVIEAPLYAYFINQNGIMNQWSPKRLDSMDAIKERIEYFKKLGLTDLQHEQEKGYIWNIVNHLKEIEKCDNSLYRQYEITLKRELRKELRRQHKQISFRDNKWFYEAAYPRIMRFYWKVERVVFSRKRDKE